MRNKAAHLWLNAFLLAPLALAAHAAEPAAKIPWPGSWQTMGRLELQATPDSVTLTNGLLADLTPRPDGILSFRARVPADPVQIWAAIRVHDRLNRYVVSLRGGVDPQVTFARYAPDGHQKFLGAATLREVLQPGEWYTLRVAASGSRFHVYLNNETLPRINVVDKSPRWNTGGVALGGGYLATEFAGFNYAPLTPETMKNITAVGEEVFHYPSPDLQAKRLQERATYQAAQVKSLPAGRGEFSLDGQWLFMPDQDLDQGTKPQTNDYDDQSWHLLGVPSFWTPTLPWLHGEGTLPGREGFSSTNERPPSNKLLVEEYDRVNSQSFAWEKTASGWYRHYLELPENLTGRKLELVFDAIAKIAQVYVNGQKVGAHTGMFGAVTCDISTAARPGKNLIAVHVVGQPRQAIAHADKVEAVAVTMEITTEQLQAMPHGIMNNNASGIWQPVRLMVSTPVRAGEVFIQPRTDGLAADLEIENDTDAPRNAAWRYLIRSNQDQQVLYRSELSEPVAISARGRSSVHFQTPKLSPRLWSPQEPNLYTLEIQLSEAGQTLDEQKTRFGFRTFQVSGSQLLLNGKPYWLRGANQFPNTLRPNDSELAHRFLAKSREGNVWVTRSVCEPFTRTWLDAADEVGMGVSQEGTWPWLMLEGPIPSDDMIAMYKAEYGALIRQWRNHPSVLMWTINNEMKFHAEGNPSIDLLTRKWRILDAVIRMVRHEDPTRPIVPDSAYMRKFCSPDSVKLKAELKFDDGDLDDAHRYHGWYNPTPFNLFCGEFGQRQSTPGRPLISQEWGTGYPRDDGWPGRSYQFTRYVPQSLVGDFAMEGQDPAIFLKRQAFMTREGVEVVRRTNREQVAGLMPFCYTTWFTQAWDAQRFTPGPAYLAVKKAMAPILISAEFRGRHFYAGDKITRRVCLANDSDQMSDLSAGTLRWKLLDGAAVLCKGQLATPAVAYYANQWVDLEMTFPASLPRPRVNATLVMELEVNGKIVAQNDVELLVATRAWAGFEQEAAVQLFDPESKFTGQFQRIDSLDKLQKDQTLVIANLAAVLKLPGGGEKLQAFLRSGGRVLVLQPGASLVKLFPDLVKSFRKASGEIVAMEIPESPAFDALEPLDTAWFEVPGQKVPQASTGTFQVDRSHSEVTTLATECAFHPAIRPGEFFRTAGAPLLEIRVGQGRLVASELLVAARESDPVAGRLLSNMLRMLK